VKQVFELVGGMITFLLDSLNQQTKIRIVSMHHEQCAGFAAEGYGRMTGIPGIAMATSGPGATNLLTAIGSCYFDSIPAIFITGQVNRHEQKGERAIRQLGFQETDIVSMSRPVTKAAWLVNDPLELPVLLEKAFAIAMTGRPGPVLLDVPMDVQRSEIEDTSRLEISHTTTCGIDVRADDFLVKLKAAMSDARRPLILIGGGVNSGRAVCAFRQLVDKLGVPVVNSLMAVDALPAAHPLRVGLIGSYGNRWANIALSESDFLLVIGSRLDVRQTGADTSNFSANRTIFHADCEIGELNNRVTGCTTLVSELNPFLKAANKLVSRVKIDPAWVKRIDELKRRWPDTSELGDIEGINPNLFFHQLSKMSNSAAAFVVDVGQHQMWAAQSLDLGSNQRFLTSGGMGAMGFSLPAAIGAAYGASSPIVVIAGDGGFQLNIQELQTIVRNRLPIKIIILNNECHGMVRQFQDSYFKGRVQSTVWGYSSPSFKAIADAYGISSRVVENPDEVEAALNVCWADPMAPFLLEVKITQKANAYPKMAFGKPISEMEPFSKPLEMEGT
jgi:acetolactate synthase-1/2/3 large subunit